MEFLKKLFKRREYYPSNKGDTVYINYDGQHNFHLADYYDKSYNLYLNGSGLAKFILDGHKYTIKVRTFRDFKQFTSVDEATNYLKNQEELDEDKMMKLIKQSIIDSISSHFDRNVRKDTRDRFDAVNKDFEVNFTMSVDKSKVKKS